VAADGEGVAAGAVSALISADVQAAGWSIIASMNERMAMGQRNGSAQ